jgi:hypothetical protein
MILGSRLLEIFYVLHRKSCNSTMEQIHSNLMPVFVILLVFGFSLTDKIMYYFVILFYLFVDNLTFFSGNRLPV